MKRKPVLFEKLSEKNRFYSKEVIGLIGTHHGVGVTFSSLMLAFYMGEEIGLKTAFLECNGHRDMGLIQNSYEWNHEDDFTFTLRHITCFKQVTKEHLPEIFSDSYECIILDFGTDFIVNREDFLRCGTKLIIGGRSEWDQQKLKRFIDTTGQIHGSETWLPLIPQANTKIIKEMEQQIGRKIWAIPFEEEPTFPSKYTIRMFDELFRA